MKGLVFGLTFKDACVKLDDIVERYKLYRYQIVQERRTKHEYTVTFDNGDNWRAVSAHENRKGCKANVAYIDHKINEEFMPIINACIAVGPWNAYNYY